MLNFGVRLKMVLVLLSVLTVALGTTSWLTIKQQENNILLESKQHGEDVVRIVSQALTFSIVGYDYHTIQMLLDEIAKSHDIRYAKVVSPKGNIMAQSGAAPTSDRDLLLFSQEVMFDHKMVGRVTIGLDNGGIINRLLSQERTVLLREAVIIVLIAIGEFLALSYIIVRPVSIISRSLDKSVDETGKITRHIPLVSNDEFGRLAAQFNEMRDQLNESNARLLSKIEFADVKLTENNHKLQGQAAELKRMNEELEQIAITDPLTGLYNRRYFEKVVETDLDLSMRHKDSNSILMIDVDRFKAVNDTYGHNTGDRVLVGIANVLNASLRKTDLICRLGGEEFIVLCRRTGKAACAGIAEKIRQAIMEHHFYGVGTERIPVTVSIGTVTCSGVASDFTVENYIHHADLALYRSKAEGRNRVTRYEDMTMASA